MSHLTEFQVDVQQDNRKDGDIGGNGEAAPNMLSMLIKDIKDTFNKIQAVLHDAEEKQMKQKAMETWLLSLRSASLSVENVLNAVSTEALLQKLHIKRGIKHRELIRGIIESIDKCECRLSQLDTMQLSLQEKLQKKWFLIVLDDVWIEENDWELNPIGREIVEKCKGLPLALKTSAGLMSSKNSASEWQLVNDNVIWELQESEILHTLKLSYDNLLSYCKRCFAYCCLFSKGYRMSKDLLIELWMANDFIIRRGEENMDAICKIHDLMHDLAGYVMRLDCCVIEPGKKFITPDEVLHLSPSCLDFHISDKSLEKLQSLRSILIFANHYRGYIRQIFNLLYVRALEYMSAGIKELSSLRRLSNFVVGKKDGARIGELGDLNLLGWELELSGLENVSGLRDAQSTNLKYKRNVLFLGLSWSGIYTRESKLETFARDQKVLEGLEPNSSLKQLSIENYIEKIISPCWLVVLLNLAVIEFSKCKNSEYIPPLGKLPNLKTIILYGMTSLKYFHDDDTTTSEDSILFPSLRELCINACSDLHSLPKLERLDIGFNYRLVSFPMNLSKLE
nr:hypothetical protein [Tanacetum cinerariifolium]